MASFSALFADELAFLREGGDAFAQANPKLSKYLSRRSSDPDIERLLEGFAFLSAKMRAKVNDDFPELTHSLINLLWPNYLRTVPSFSMMKFTAGDKVISQPTPVKKGSEITSQPVEGCVTRWQTCWEIDILPINLVDDGLEVRRSKQASSVSLELQTEAGLAISEAVAKPLVLHLSGGYAVSSVLYLYIFRFLKRVVVEFQDGSEATLAKDAIKPGGMAKHQGLLPYPRQAFDGYRLFQEFFLFPEKFLFVEIDGLAKLTGANKTDRAAIRFEFSKPLPSELSIRAQHFSFNCVPVVNLFEHSADPVRNDGRTHEFAIRPMTSNPSWHEIFSVDLVYGVPDNQTIVDESDILPEYIYQPFESFDHELELEGLEERRYYRHRVEPFLVQQRANNGFRHLISFTRASSALDVPATETVSFNITASNRELPLQLEVGDINQPSNTSPSFASFSNITKPTSPVPPPIDGNLHWTLISNLAGSYLSLSSIEALRQVLSAYDFRALVDRQSEREGNQRLEGLKEVISAPMDLMVRGLPTRGIKSDLLVTEANFLNEGDLYVFLTVLAEFMTSFASINSFHQLDVRAQDTNETYSFPAKLGRQPAL